MTCSDRYTVRMVDGSDWVVFTTPSRERAWYLMNYYRARGFRIADPERDNERADA